MTRPIASLAVLFICIIWFAGCQSGSGPIPVSVTDFDPLPCENAIYVSSPPTDFHTSSGPVKYTRTVKDEATGKDCSLEVLMGPHPLDDPGGNLAYSIIETASTTGGPTAINITVDRGYIYIVQTDLPTTSATYCKPVVKTRRVSAVGEGTKFALCNLYQVGDPTRVYMWEYPVKLDSLGFGTPPQTHRTLSSADNNKVLNIEGDSHVDRKLENISSSAVYTEFQELLRKQAVKCGITVP